MPRLSGRRPAVSKSGPGKHSLDAQLQKLLKTGHQDTVDATLNALFKEDLNAYDVLMDSVEAASESGSVTIDAADGVAKQYDVLLVAAPILAWTRFAIASGAIPADILATLSAHFSAHLLADGTHMAMSPTLFSIDQLPRSHVETYGKVHKLAQAAIKGTVLKADAKVPETAPFLADTRYLLVAVVAPAGAPLFRWQMPANQINFANERATALEQWRAQVTPTINRLLPGCGVELLLPEAYYMACREADKLIRPVSIRAAVHYLTHTLAVEPGELRAVIAGFGEENADGQAGSGWNCSSADRPSLPGRSSRACRRLRLRCPARSRPRPGRRSRPGTRRLPRCAGKVADAVADFSTSGCSHRRRAVRRRRHGISYSHSPRVAPTSCS
jgi:hypothetical protein